MAVDIEKAKKELLLLRDELGGEDERLAKSLGAGLEEESGEESSNQHMADVATITHDRELDDSILGNTERVLAQVERALQKISEGSYGICDRCGRPIDEGRLDVIPYATLCVEDQRKLERAEGID